jgi:hypothetical protein
LNRRIYGQFIASSAGADETRTGEELEALHKSIEECKAAVRESRRIAAALAALNGHRKIES